METGTIMKISICGKGGSGKSTVVTLLANAASQKGFYVLVVDSDESNSGLYRKLGFEKAPTPLMALIGGRKGFKEAMAKATAKDSEHQMTIFQYDEIQITDIPAQYKVSNDGITMVSIGKILQALEGCACPMGVLSREFLKKLHLSPNELVLVDMEAGIEHFGRGVESSVDSVLIVVEPSYESIDFAQRVKGIASSIGIPSIWAVINKITSEELLSVMTDKLHQKNVEVIGHIVHDEDVFKAEFEGNPTFGEKATENIEVFLDNLLNNRGKLLED